MDFKQIKYLLAKEAKQKNICSEWHERILNAINKEQLLQLYLDGIDFSLSENYPSNTFLEKNFRDHLEEYNILLNESKALSNQSVVVGLGTSELVYSADEYSVSRVFIKDNTKAIIKASGCSFIMIDVFEGCEVNIVASENSKVCVNAYLGAKHSFNKLDNSHVKINLKKTKTYE